VDVSSAYAVSASWARAPVSAAAADQGRPVDAAFPFHQPGIDSATPRCGHRITYVGELGWELYVPTAFAAGTYELSSSRARRPVTQPVYAVNSLASTRLPALHD